MRDMVAAVSVGRVDDKTVVDLDYAEEAHDEGHVADIPVAVIPSTNEITLLQLDGNVEPSRLKEALTMAIEAAHTIKAVQVAALKDKYKKGPVDTTE